MRSEWGMHRVGEWERDVMERHVAGQGGEAHQKRLPGRETVGSPRCVSGKSENGYSVV